MVIHSSWRAFLVASAREETPHLGVGVREVAPDRRLGDVQLLAYLAVGEAAGGQEHDLKLSRGEHALRSSPGLLEHSTRHLHHHVLALRVEDGRADRADKVLAR